MLLAAKLKEPVTPSYENMVKFLSNQEMVSVTKEEVNEMEKDILVRFGFDFNFPNPIEFVDRYLRLLEQ